MLVCIIFATAATAPFLISAKNISNAPVNNAGTAAEITTGIYKGLLLFLFL